MKIYFFLFAEISKTNYYNNHCANRKNMQVFCFVFVFIDILVQSFDRNIKEKQKIQHFTHNDGLPLKVDVVDAHHLVGREGNINKTMSVRGEFLDVTCYDYPFTSSAKLVEVFLSLSLIEALSDPRILIAILSPTCYR